MYRSVFKTEQTDTTKIDETLSALPTREGVVENNARKEYGGYYREVAENQKPTPPPAKIEKNFEPPESIRQEVIILCDAGQRIITAGYILCFAGLTAGLKVTQKNEYNITVLRGPSISEVILSPEDIGFNGIYRPAAIVAIGQEGVDRRANLFEHLDKDALIILAKGVEVPSSNATVHLVDFKKQGIKTHDRALASLSVMAKLNKVINLEMLQSALEARFKEPVLTSALGLVDRVDIA